jgi:hypothetical protein
MAVETKNGIAEGVREEIKKERSRNLNRRSADGWSAGKNRVELLQQLEASLIRSHRALIALDLAAIGQGTREQRTLCRNLAAEIRQSNTARDGRAAENPELAREQRCWERRVLEASRLQAALLKRAQRKLVVIGNMLAGAERNYVSPMDPNLGTPSSLTASNRDMPCRV